MDELQLQREWDSGALSGWAHDQGPTVEERIKYIRLLLRHSAEDRMSPDDKARCRFSLQQLGAL